MCSDSFLRIRAGVVKTPLRQRFEFGTQSADGSGCVSDSKGPRWKRSHPRRCAPPGRGERSLIFPFGLRQTKKIKTTYKDGKSDRPMNRMKVQSGIRVPAGTNTSALTPALSPRRGRMARPTQVLTTVSVVGPGRFQAVHSSCRNGAGCYAVLRLSRKTSRKQTPHGL